MRVPIRATLFLAAMVAMAASLAACGTVAAPSAGKPAPNRTLAALTGRGGPPAGTRAEATALARRMLSRLRLPGGTHRLPGKPVPSALRDPALWAGGIAALDQHRLFRLRQPMTAVAAAWTAHAPAGMTLAGTGDQSGPAGVVSMLVSYTPRSLPAGIDAAQLVLTLTPARSGGSLARADAQVIWFPPRSAAEYIDPSRYLVLTITVTLTNPRAHSLHKVVTSRTEIARLARALNRSPVQPINFAHCPMIFATYRLALAVSRHSPAAVVVSATRWPCLGAGIVVGGKSQPSLANAAVVVNAADRLLGHTPQP